MISETALARACRPAIFERARMIAQREGRMGERACTYEGRLTHLSANVDSSSGRPGSYEASIIIDEVADEVFSCSCSCPAAARFPGPCKHSIAVALDFNRHPERYEGMDERRHAATSSAITAYLDRVARQSRPRIVREDATDAGTVRVLARLLLDRDLFLSLRVAGPRGSYVIRDLGEFESLISEGAYHEYGKNLGFVHETGSFAKESRALVAFVCRCVRNRRSFAAGRRFGHVYATSGSTTLPGKELRLSPPEMDELMELLVGRTVSFEAASPVGGRPVAQGARAQEVLVADGDPRLALEVVALGDDAYELVRHGSAVAFSSTERLFVLQDGVLLRCSERLWGAAAFLQQVYCSPATQLVMTHEDARRFVLGALPSLERSLPVTLPAELDALRPEPLRLTFALDRSGRSVTCDARATYGERSVSLFDRAQGDEHLWRDGVAEAQARSVVLRYFTTAREGGALVSRPDAETVARIVFEGVAELRRLGEVRSSEAFLRLAPRTRPQARVRVSSHGGLIDLTVATDDLPPSELRAVLSSYRQRRRYHRLRDGSFVDLVDADLREASLVADELGLSAAELAAGTVRIPSYKAFLLDALVPDEDKDASFAACLEGFRSVDPDAYEPPAELAGRLRPYQVTGFKWLSSLVDMGFGGILADEMGLGKSAQVISLVLARRGQGQTLVVCPASLVYNWVAEFAKFAPELDVVAVAGDAAERERLRRQEGHEVLITSYYLLRRDVEAYASRRLWCVVVDEAQFIKNHQTLAARAVKTLDAQHRLALTGTPVENRLSELWSIFDFLMPGLLGGYERFRDRYEQPIEYGDEEAAQMLRAAVGPFVLRRSKADVLDDLPDKLEQVVSCHMEHEQRQLYAAREQALRESLMGDDAPQLGSGRMQVLAELTRLRQLCCDPRLVYEDYDGGSCKLDAIWELVSSAIDASAKVLVFSQFTGFLSLVAERLEKEGVTFYTITGSTPKQRRVELVDAFNADETPVFLVSLRAGGTGLNLVGASVVIHADPWWNAAVEDQATDRAHRIGQTRDVAVYKIIARGSIEERICRLQESKLDLAGQVVGEGGGPATLASLRREDLLALLGE